MSLLGLLIHWITSQFLNITFYKPFYTDFFRGGSNVYMSLFPFVRPSVRPSVAHHISRTVHHLIRIFGTRVKWYDYLQALFSFFFFFFFLILIFWAVRGVKGIKIAPNEKLPLHPLHAISQEQYSVAYDHGFWYTCVKW